MSKAADLANLGEFPQDFEIISPTRTCSTGIRAAFEQALVSILGLLRTAVSVNRERRHTFRVPQQFRFGLHGRDSP